MTATARTSPGAMFGLTVASFLAAFGWYLFLVDAWTAPSIYIASNSLLSYLAVSCSAFILVEYRMREKAEQTVSHAALLFVAIVSMVRCIRALIDPEITLGSPDELLNMLADLSIFGIILLAGVLRRRSGSPRSRSQEVFLLVVCGLAAQGILAIIWNTLPNSLYPPIGLLLGVSGVILMSSAGFFWLKIAPRQRKFDPSFLTVGILLYGASWIPLVLSLSSPSVLWTLAFSMRGVGLTLLLLSTGIPYVLRGGASKSYAYALTFGLASVVILPLFITRTASAVLPGGLILGRGVFLVVHLGAAILAGLIALLTMIYNSPRFEIRRYALTGIYVSWGGVEAYQIFDALTGSDTSGSSVVPYAAAITLTLLLLYFAVRWTSSPASSWVRDHRWLLLIVVLVSFLVDSWAGEAIQNSLIGAPPEAPYARIIILTCTLFIMFAFVYYLGYLLKESKGRITVDLLSVGFLLPWIVPTLMRASFGELSAGWTFADFLMLLTLLFGPAIMGAVYLGEMERAEEQHTKAMLYADLLVHDITNYHQALELSLGLVALEGGDESTQQRALEDAFEELQRADRLIKSVRQMGLAEELDPERLGDIDLVSVIEAVQKVLRQETGLDVDLHLKNAPAGAIAIANDLLVDALVNLLEDRIRSGGKDRAVDIDITESQEKGSRYWDLVITDHSDSVEPSILAALSEKRASGPNRPLLGISVARNLIEALGGHLSAISRESQKHEAETVFVVTLKRA